MRITKLGHSCVRLQDHGAALVIDPGVWSGSDALAGADAVLITHEHADHFEPDTVRAAMVGNAELEVWTNPSVAAQLAEFGARVHVVSHGDVVDVRGFQVRVDGELHALIHPDVPTIPNVAFTVDQVVYHPGDSFTVPGEPVDTLLLPVTAPWLKVAELIDFAREMRPRQAIAIHDALGNDKLMGLIGRLIMQLALTEEGQYRQLEPGSSIEV